MIELFIFKYSVFSIHLADAVRRRRKDDSIRESYRRQKGLLPAGLDVLFIYTLPNVQPYEAIFADMTAALQAISAALLDGCFSQFIDN